MKNILNKLMLLLIAPIILVSCEDRVLTELNSNATISVNLDASSVVLESENADLNALKISWSQPDFGYNAAPNYKILIDNVGDNFSEPQTVSVGGELQKDLTTSQLNGFLLKLEFEEGVPGDVEN